MVDISVIFNGVNRSVDVAIDYCRKRGLEVELCSHLSESQGDYICIVDEVTFYERYFFHHQWVCLNHKNKDCDHFVIKKCTVLAEDEFYCADATYSNKFFRKNTTCTVPFIEDQIFFFCTLFRLPAINSNLPGDNALVVYRDFFKKD